MDGMKEAELWRGMQKDTISDNTENSPSSLTLDAPATAEKNTNTKSLRRFIAPDLNSVHPGAIHGPKLQVGRRSYKTGKPVIHIIPMTNHERVVNGRKNKA